ncbi:MAG: ATP-dependent RNA helicase RhlE [Bacteroidetes bacterium ADurb.Bin217]|nr:MAG: ATP-dependent RNA helicase RhlE [Bacteroidetes bacterium ADurb.Bin217]
MTFDEFNIHEQLLEAISYMNYEKASPIQELAIPPALLGHDILACAQTGTGKTATFVIPVIHDIVTNKLEGTTTLILVPTRELAIQIHQEIQGFSYFTDTTSKPIYGGDKGADWDAQKRALTEGTNVIIATPGRLLAHLKLGYVDFKQIQHFVLDEADRMLDMGFYDDIQQILSYIPEERQTLFFSATMPPVIQKLADKILQNPKEIRISISKPAEGVTQKAYLAYPHQKNEVIHHILQQNPNYDSIIIFTSTKRAVQKIVHDISRKNPGISVQGISSDLEQKDREEVLLKFRSKNTKVLVATDVMSRGIDIKGINLVINYDVPGEAVDYVHRVGRTARADSKGEAITLISDVDMYKFARIEALIEKEVPKLPIPAHLGEAPVWKAKSSKPQGARPQGNKRHNNKPHGGKTQGDKPHEEKSHGEKPQGQKKKRFWRPKKNPNSQSNETK